MNIQEIKKSVQDAKEKAVVKTGVRLDPNVVLDRYYSPSEEYTPPPNDKYALSMYNKYPLEVRDPLIQKIAAFIAGGYSKVKACKSAKHEGFTMTYTELRFWMKTVPIYAEWITEAEDEKFDRLFDEIPELADDLEDTINSDYESSPKDKIDVAKVRIKAREYVTSKARPKKFGGKIEDSGKVGIMVHIVENRTDTYTPVTVSEILSRVDAEKQKERIRQGLIQEVNDDDTSAEEL